MTQVIDPQLVDAVLEETGAGEQRLRLLPARIVVYFVLALAFFERSSYTAVWGKLGAGLRGITPVVPAASSLSRTRRRAGAAPLRRLFGVISESVATPAQRACFYRGLRVVAVDGTTLCVSDERPVTWLSQALRTGQRVRPPAAAPGRPGGGRYPCSARGGVRPGHHRGTRLCAPPARDLDESMVLPADAYYDAHDFLQVLGATRAAFLVRATRKRRPAVRRALPDGSYLTTIARGKYKAGAGYGRIQVRIIEAWMTVTLADGTGRTELWRLMTSLLDAERHPAEELIALCHRRWQAETCYFSLKSTILDGRVLRSRTVPGIEQEVYALLTVYQALIRVASDLVTARPGLSVQRVSLTVLLNAGVLDPPLIGRTFIPRGVGHGAGRTCRGGESRLCESAGLRGPCP